MILKSNSIAKIVASFSSLASAMLLAPLICAGLPASPAGAVSVAVKRACMGDYFSYCSQHGVGSPELRRCMREAGPRLSTGCVNALIAAGEVPQPEVSRRAASR